MADLPGPPLAFEAPAHDAAVVIREPPRVLGTISTGISRRAIFAKTRRSAWAETSDAATGRTCPTSVRLDAESEGAVYQGICRFVCCRPIVLAAVPPPVQIITPSSIMLTTF
jgi:hypothetical protein